MKKNEYIYLEGDDKNPPHCIVRSHNRRYVMWKTPNNSYVMRFERPAIEGDKDNPPHVMCDGRKTISHITLSSDAMKTIFAMWIGWNGPNVELPFIHDVNKKNKEK